MSGLEIFEEVRFIVELIAAEQIFLWSFARRKERFLLKSSLGFAVLIALAIGYIPVREWVVGLDQWLVTNTVSISWYIFLALLTLIHMKLCYKITYSDAVFMGIAGYAVQHIEYIVVNEVLAMGIWPDITSHLGLYMGISFVTTLGWYILINFIFASKLRSFHGKLYEDRVRTVIYFLVILVVMFSSSFLGQNLFLNGYSDATSVNYLGATYDFFNCLLVLLVQYSIFRISALNHEKDIIKQILYERQKQYELSRENIDIINQKCHDLKHQLQALKTVSVEERNQHIEEVEKSIMIYDNVIKTENEVLNTILSEKSLFCERHHIRLTCIIDGGQLDFMGTLDIYTLLGNALDNAIECVMKEEDEEKRVISLTISANGGFLSIQTNNYYNGNITMSDGLPVSTKKNRQFHGFGMKSMKHVTEKYGGAMYSRLDKGIFMLQIVIPIPVEFARMLKESRE